MRSGMEVSEVQLAPLLLELWSMPPPHTVCCVPSEDIATARILCVMGTRESSQTKADADCGAVRRHVLCRRVLGCGAGSHDASCMYAPESSTKAVGVSGPPARRDHTEP